MLSVIRQVSIYFNILVIYFNVKGMSVSYSRTPLIRKLVIRISNYPDRPGPCSKSVENSTKLTCLAITGYRIKYCTVLWLIELQMRRGRKVWTRVHPVNSNSRASHWQCSIFSKKNPIIRIFLHIRMAHRPN